jgi:hypothetical protein
MNRITRAVVCAVPVLASQLLLVAAPALADSGQSKPLQTGWYWYRASDAYPLQPAPAVVPPSDPTVPDGGLPVSVNPQDGSAMKESYLSFDMSAVPLDATIDSFQVKAPVIANYTQQSEAPKVVACLPPRTWTAGPAQAWSDKPYIDCGSGKVAGKYDATTSTWSFDLTQFASSWLTGNTGVALTNDPEYKTPYQVVFDAAKITATVTWTPAVVVSVPQTPQVPQPQAAPPPVPSYGGLSSGSTGGTTFVPPAVAPVVQPQPQVASGPVSQPVALASVPLRVGGNAPGTGFWVLAVMLAGLLALASWILGDTSAPVAVRTGDSRLDRALRSRRLGGALGSAAPARGSIPRVKPLSVRPV